MLAGLIFPVVDKELLLKVSRLSILIEEVSEGCATLGDGFGEYAAYFVGKLFQSWFGDSSSLPARVDTAAEQGFACVDIAYADDDLAIHDVLLDAGFPPPAGFMQIVGVEVVAQWLWSEVCQELMLVYVSFFPEDGAKSAWVMEPELDVVFELHREMVMFFER